MTSVVSMLILFSGPLTLSVRSGTVLVSSTSRVASAGRSDDKRVAFQRLTLVYAKRPSVWRRTFHDAARNYRTAVVLVAALPRTVRAAAITRHSTFHDTGSARPGRALFYPSCLLSRLPCARDVARQANNMTHVGCPYVRSPAVWMPFSLRSLPHTISWADVVACLLFRTSAYSAVGRCYDTVWRSGLDRTRARRAALRPSYPLGAWWQRLVNVNSGFGIRGGGCVWRWLVWCSRLVVY